jgi:ParB/RepB/Spo0J family partition protein
MLELPLSALKVGAANVRADVALDDNLKTLVASIRSVGLLQPLVVTGDSSTGFEVIAGRRRLAALSALNDEGHVFDTVPCVVVDQETASEASLAENYAREQMKPTDLYRAFVTVLERNADYTDQDLARAFDLELDVVRRTLRLGRIHFEIIEAFDAGTNRYFTMETLQAFAATEDRDLQKAVFDSLGGGSSYNLDARSVRKALGVAAGDLKLKVVGVEAYEAAGGRFERDLFNTQDPTAGRVLDPEILDGLANTKLCNLLAELVGGDESIKLNYQAPAGQYGGIDESLRVYGTVELSAEKRLEYEALEQKIAALQDYEHGDGELPEGYDAETFDEDALATEIETLEGQMDEINASAIRTYPPGRKIAVPRMVSGWKDGERTPEELTFTIYWADKQAKKDAEAAAVALERAEKGEAAAPAKEKAAPTGDNLTGRANDTLQAIRKDMLKQACAETPDALAPWRLIYITANAAAVRYGANQGLKHISTGDYIPLNELPLFKKNPTFAGFMELPEEQRFAIAALLLSSYIDNHPIIWKEPTFAMWHFGAKAQAEARRYWTPDADFFDMFKKQTIADMVREVSPRLADYIEREKVATAKGIALDFFTAQKEDHKLRGASAAELEAAKTFVPKWLRLAPPEPKAPAKPKAKAKAKAKAKPKKKGAANAEPELEEAA